VKTNRTVTTELFMDMQGGIYMDVSGVSSSVASTQTTQAAATVAADTSTQAASSAQDTTAVVYEKSTQDSTSKAYTSNKAIVAQLQSDAQARMEQLQSLVSTLITKQGAAYGNANIFTSDFWKNFSANGGTVDEAAVKQAQEDISENGYWGVSQTSSRILDFAKAICGNDPDKIDEMQQAFEKGFSQATKAWGDTLPSLSQDTYTAVIQGFDDWRKEAGVTTES
jgi:membrane-associated HD superfamily phosphohydrolase